MQTAWVSDDAYITFRSIENLLHGYGPVYNIGERVQTFTHPLWFLLQSVGNIFMGWWYQNPLGGGQLYFLNVLLSFAISALAVLVLVLGVAGSARGAFAGILLLLLSKAYVDYSTSGLENPLTHLITVSFLATYFAAWQKGPAPLFVLALFAALAATNRPDLLLLFLPALLGLFWASPHKGRALGTLALGFLPLFAWEAFSTIYYGTPFPNTAFAKINTGISLLSLVRQGGAYCLNSLRMDPITLLTIGLVLLSGVYRKDRPPWPILSGILLYLFYVLAIGGDFMSGRHFTAPFVTAVALLTRMEFGSFRRLGAFVGAALVIGVAPIILVPERSPTFGAGGQRVGVFVDSNGISDEQHFYYEQMGFLGSLTRGAPAARARDTWIYHAQTPARVVIVGTLGVAGYNYGPDVHVIDRNALADPLMGRMPLQDPKHWRIGHFRHIIPDGYVETLATGTNQIRDPNVAAYYDKLSFVIKGPLWDWSRWVEIWNWNTGKYDDLLRGAGNPA